MGYILIRFSNGYDMRPLDGSFGGKIVVTKLELKVVSEFYYGHVAKAHTT